MGGELLLGPPGERCGGDGPLLPPRLHPLLPRDSFSNISSVFLANIIRETGQGEKKHARAFLWLFGIQRLYARCPGTPAVPSPRCHLHTGTISDPAIRVGGPGCGTPGEPR